MSRRTKIILIAVLSLLILIVLFLVIWNYFFLKPVAPANINDVPDEGVSPVLNANVAPPPQPELNEEDKSQNGLIKIALSFSERFGSFSNQSEFENIKDLEVLMSNSMKNWAEQYVEEELAKRGDTSVYYGVTTKAISNEVISFDDEAGRAEIKVSAQRWEAEETPTNTKVFYQDILIKFVKQADEWKVDGAFWQ